MSEETQNPPLTNLARAYNDSEFVGDKILDAVDHPHGRCPTCGLPREQHHAIYQDVWSISHFGRAVGQLLVELQCPIEVPVDWRTVEEKNEDRLRDLYYGPDGEAR